MRVPSPSPKAKGNRSRKESRTHFCTWTHDWIVAVTVMERKPGHIKTPLTSQTYNEKKDKPYNMSEQSVPISEEQRVLTDIGESLNLLERVRFGVVRLRQRRKRTQANSVDEKGVFLPAAKTMIVEFSFLLHIHWRVLQQSLRDNIIVITESALQKLDDECHTEVGLDSTTATHSEKVPSSQPQAQRAAN